MKSLIEYIEFLKTICTKSSIDSVPENLTSLSQKKLEAIAAELNDNIDPSVVQVENDRLSAKHNPIMNTTLQSDKVIQRGILEELFKKDTYYYTDKNGRKFEQYFIEESLNRADNTAYMFENIENSDTDLILVLEHPGCSDLCEPFQNKILSKSGKSKKYGSLKRAKADLLFRTNCTHVAVPYYSGITDVPETKYSKKENAKIREKQALETSNAKKIRDLRISIDKSKTLGDIEKVKTLESRLKNFKKNNKYDSRRANAPIK